MTPLLVALTLLIPLDALRPAAEAEYARPIVAPATVYAPAVRIDPPTPPTVEQIIRDVWPDHLEERALRIAWRESRWVPTARNPICFGLFQIYFKVHRGWLADYGVDEPADLFDPRLNATVAYALYLMDGWRPWAATA